MQIDWFTFTCQVINFLVLVWLLKRLLYRPVLNAVAEREKGIVERLQSAASREAEAEQALKSYEQQQSELAELKNSLLAEAAADVESWRKEQQARVREEVEQVQESWRAAIAREHQQFFSELKQRTARQVQEVVRHVLRELADHDLEQQTLRRFVSHLDEMPATESVFRMSIDTQPIVIRTAFALSPDDEKTLCNSISNRIRGQRIQYEVDPDLICGIELVVGDRKLEWNVDHYLNSLERSIMQALDERVLMRTTN